MQRARVVRVVAFLRGQAGGEDLRRDDIGDGSEYLRNRAREADHARGHGVHFAVGRVGDGHDFGFQPFQLAQGVADRRPRDAHGSKGEHRETRLYQRDRAVQKIGRGKPLRHHVAGLHQLQRELEGIGIIQAAAHHHRRAHVPVALRERADLGLQAKRIRRQLRNPLQVGQPYLPAQGIRQQVEDQDLAGIGLGCGHASLAAGAHQEDVLGQARQRTGALVGDSQRQRSGGACPFQHQVGVGGFAGLRDSHHQRVAVIDRGVI